MLCFDKLTHECNNEKALLFFSFCGSVSLNSIQAYNPLYRIMRPHWKCHSYSHSALLICVFMGEMKFFSTRS